MRKITKTQKIKADRFLSGDYSDETISLFRKGETPLDSLAEETLKELDLLGANLPSDEVGISLSTGELVYDILSFHREKHVAPILVRRQEKELENLFNIIETTEEDGDLVLSDAQILSIKNVMCSDSLWEKTPFHVKTPTGAYVRINSTGVFMFKEVIDEIIRICDEI